jgi:hypothetical protein
VYACGREQLIARVKDDLPQKTIEVLQLDQPIDNLYEIVEQLPNREQINILFIQGLEHSFYEYEQVKFGDTMSVTSTVGKVYHEFSIT